MYFTIDRDNDIMAHSVAPAAQDGILLFGTEKEFTKMSAEWSVGRLVEVWNSFAGVPPFSDLKPVKKFENRGIATRRIWGAIQKLEPARVPDTVQPKASTKPAKGTPPVPQPVTPAADEPVAAVETTATVPAATQQPEPGVLETYGPEADKPPKQARAPRESSAKDNVIAMLKRGGGVTLQEIMAATGWQAHTCRAFVSTVPKKLGIEISSTKREDGARVYAAVK